MASEGCVYPLKFCTMRQPEKDGTVSLSSDTGATHGDFGSIAMLSAQYTLDVFKCCDLLVLKIIIL